MTFLMKGENMSNTFETTLTSALIAAQEVAGELLADSLPDRYKHSQAVSAKACEIADNLGYPQEVCVHLRIAGILHDVGYSPGLVQTGQHAYDGGLFLLEQPGLSNFAPDVGWHSNAKWEGRARGLEEPLIPQPLTNLHRILWIADFTTSATGEPVTLQERIQGIRERYDEDSPVIKALDDSMPELSKAAEFCGIELYEPTIA